MQAKKCYGVFEVSSRQVHTFTLEEIERIELVAEELGRVVAEILPAKRAGRARKQ